MAGNHRNITRKNYRVSKKKSVLLSDLLKENVELITIVNVCQVFFIHSVQKVLRKLYFHLQPLP